MINKINIKTNNTIYSKRSKKNVGHEVRSFFFYKHEVICIRGKGNCKQFLLKHNYSKKQYRWKNRTIYYKRADFVNKFSFLLPMKKIWYRLYKTQLLTKIINNSVSAGLSSTRVMTEKTLSYSKNKDFILFNKYWNHYTGLSEQQLPLWNFKTFNKERLLMRCSYDSFSQDIPFFFTSQNFYKDFFTKCFKIIKIIPLLYFWIIFYLIIIVGLSFFSYQTIVSSGVLFDMYLSQAFYFIWDFYLTPINSYSYVMFQYPEYIFRMLAFFELIWVYKGPGYWESFILDESELFLILIVKSLMYFQYITLNEIWNTWAPERSLSEFMYVTRSTYTVYEQFVRLFLPDFLVWQYTWKDIGRIGGLLFIENFTTSIIKNLVSIHGLGGIGGSGQVITLSYGFRTGDFKFTLYLIKLRLKSYTGLTLDPQTWFDRAYEIAYNYTARLYHNIHLEFRDDLDKGVALSIAFQNISQDLFINFIYYRIQWAYLYFHEYIIVKIYQGYIVNIFYDQFILNIYNFFYTYFYWHTTWYLFKAITFIWQVCWYILRKLLFIDYFLDWWDYFSFRIDMPLIYKIYKGFEELFNWSAFLFFELLTEKGYYIYKKLGDFLIIQVIVFLENTFPFGLWLQLSTLSIQLFSGSFYLYFHDSVILFFTQWAQDLGSWNFYAVVRAIDAGLVSLWYPITFLFFDTKWAFPVDTLNVSWRVYNTDWYVPETFWFLKRFGPVFYEHVHVRPPYTLIFGSDFFFFSVSFLWNLDFLDKPTIDVPFWGFEFLEQEWFFILQKFVMHVQPKDATDEEIFRYANYDIYNRVGMYTPFWSSTLIIRDLIYTGVKLTTYLPSHTSQMLWGITWYFIYNLLCNFDDMGMVIMYKKTWHEWFLWIFNSFYFTEIRLLYLLQDGFFRIEKLKLFLKIYKVGDYKETLVWINKIMSNSVFLPASDDIFFKSFYYIVNSTRTINVFENIVDYLLLRDFYGSNLLAIANDLWFNPGHEFIADEIYSSLTVIFWEAFNMWTLDDVDTIEKGDSTSLIDGIDVHNPFIWIRYLYFPEFSEFLLNKYWQNLWIRPLYNHWWFRADVQSGRELMQTDHPYWTATNDRHLWKGFINYNYNLPYRKGFITSKSVGFKPGYSLGESISKKLALGKHSGYDFLGTDLLNDKGVWHQKTLMFRNLNNDPLYLIMQNTPEYFQTFLKVLEASPYEKPHLKRHDFFLNLHADSSILGKIYHFIFVDSLYSFFISSGLPAGYIDTLQLSNPIINFLMVFKFIEVYWFYTIYVSVLINIFLSEFLTEHFETYFLAYFLFFSKYSLLKKIFFNEEIAINLFMVFYKIKLFIELVWKPWLIGFWELITNNTKYSSWSFLPISLENERFLQNLKKNNQLEWFLMYYKYIYKMTFNMLWFEYKLTSYFIIKENEWTSISNHNYVADFHTWKYENTSAVWVKNQKIKWMNIFDELNINYMKPYLYDGYLKIITKFSKTLNDIFVYIRTNFYFFNEDLILKDDYIQSMVFFNLTIEAVLRGYKFSSEEVNSLFKVYVMDDLFFKELEIYFTYIHFYQSDNYILFFNPWTDYVLTNDFNIYEYVWNKRNVRWHGLPGFWYMFDIFYFFIFVIFVVLWFLIINSYLRSLAKKGDPWFDFIVTIYPEIIQRHKKAYLFKDTFVVDEEIADNILEYYKYYYDSFDYIYLPYRSFKTGGLPKHHVNKDPEYIDVDPLTGHAVYLADLTKLKKPFTNLFSYNSRFLLKKSLFEANQYTKRQRKTLKKVPSLSWYNYKDSFKEQTFKKTPWSIWWFFIIFLFFFSSEYFFFFKHSWLFNFFFVHKLSAYTSMFFWDKLFFSLNPYFFDGVFSVFLFISLFFIWYVIWVLYLYFYFIWHNVWLLTSNPTKMFYILMLSLLINLIQSFRFLKNKIGFVDSIWFFKKNTSQEFKSLTKKDYLFIDSDITAYGRVISQNKRLTSTMNIENMSFLKGVNLQNNSRFLQNITKTQQQVLINKYMTSRPLNDLYFLNNISVTSIDNVDYNYFLEIQFKLYNNKKESFITRDKSNIFYMLDTMLYNKKYNLNIADKETLLTSRLKGEQYLESKWTLTDHIKTTALLTTKMRKHNNLSVSFVEDFFNKSKKLSIFNKWDIAEFVQMFDDMPWIDRGAPQEIQDPNVPSFLGDQMPELLDYVGHQWHREENLYTKDFTNLLQREVLERSAQFVGIENSWHFVDLHDKLDISSNTGSFFRKQFYDDLKNQKHMRIESKKAWTESSINMGLMSLDKKYNYTVKPLSEAHEAYKHVGMDLIGDEEFRQVFYKDYRQKTIFKSIQGDIHSNQSLNLDGVQKIIIEDLDLLFDLDYDITNI